MDLLGNEKNRLQPTPVRTFNRFLIEAFGQGACTCHRCRESGNVEDSYEQAHTFVIDGQAYNRRFARTSTSDVMGVLANSWKAFYKKAMPTEGMVDMPGIQAFTDAESLPFLVPLLVGAQCIREQGDAWVFSKACQL